jgi:phosphonate transport system ATP-binding protein
MHHVDLALKYASRVIGIKEGSIVFDGSPSEVNEDILVKIYGRSLKHNEVLGE